MSYKTNLIKTAIKWTPIKMILPVLNLKLKGIAKVTDLSFDLEARTAFVQATLYDEDEAIEVSLQDFAIIKDGEAFRIIIREAQANRLWLDNLLARMVGKAWKIPAIPEFAGQLELAAELFKQESAGQDDN